MLYILKTWGFLGIIEYPDYSQKFLNLTHGSFSQDRILKNGLYSTLFCTSEWRVVHRSAKTCSKQIAWYIIVKYRKQTIFTTFTNYIHRRESRQVNIIKTRFLKKPPSNCQKFALNSTALQVFMRSSMWQVCELATGGQANDNKHLIFTSPGPERRDSRALLHSTGLPSLLLQLGVCDRVQVQRRGVLHAGSHLQGRGGDADPEVSDT